LLPYFLEWRWLFSFPCAESDPFELQHLVVHDDVRVVMFKKSIVAAVRENLRFCVTIFRVPVGNE
jgi:hypothetical protein